MSAPFTPGPWAATEERGSYSVFDEDGRPLAHLWDGNTNLPAPQFANSSYLTHGEHVANARLIAAAPDLYSACARWIEYLKSDGGPDIYAEMEIVNEMERALRKATSDA